MILSILLSLFSMLIVVLPGIVAVIYLWRANRRWVPRETSRNAGIRRFESLLVLFVLSFLGLLWLNGDIPTTFTPKRFGPAYSDAVRSVHSWALILGSSIALLGVFLAWRVNTSVAVVILMISGLTASVYVQTEVGQITHREWAAKHAPNLKSDSTETTVLQPVKLRFELMDNLAGADLWINGTLLGKTPFEITDQELFAKVPKWGDEETRKFRSSTDSIDSFKTPQGGQIRRWGWCPIHFLSRTDMSMTLYYRVDLNGVPGYSTLVSQRADESNISNSPAQILKLDTVFPPWEVAIEQLLDQARLNNYDVDEAWREAFRSYGGFAAQQLERVLKDEPDFEKVRLKGERTRHGLREVNDSTTAWKLLMRIEEEARTAHEYDSGSASGIAVDLLVPLLDPDQLIDHAIQLLKSTPNPDPQGVSQGGDRFSTYSNGPSQFGKEVALWPIAQAIWRLDQKLDLESGENTTDVAITEEDLQRSRLDWALHPELDNLVERRITPVLMQLSYLNPGRLSYAAVLGGSAYELFLLRNDWRKPPEQTGMNPHVGDFQNYVNPWFHKLMWLRSPLGRAFRMQQSEKLLSIARNGISNFDLQSGSRSRDLDFLFLDRAFSKDHPSLAMRFWPDLDGRAKGMPKHAQAQLLKMRWDYLGSLWPESTTEMFIEAFRNAVATSDYMFVPNLPESLSPEIQFEILQAVLASEVERVAKLPDDPKEHQYDGPKHRGTQSIGELRTKLYLVDGETAARKLIADMQADPKHLWWSQMASFLENNRRYDHLMKLMTDSSEPRLQLMVLPAIEHHPIPKRQEWLARLLEAKDEKVRIAAASVKQRLTELGKRTPKVRTPLEATQKSG